MQLSSSTQKNSDQIHKIVEKFAMLHVHHVNKFNAITHKVKLANVCVLSSVSYKKKANAIEAATGLLIFRSLGLMASHFRPKIVLLLLLLLLLSAVDELS